MPTKYWNFGMPERMHPALHLFYRIPLQWRVSINCNVAVQGVSLSTFESFMSEARMLDRCSASNKSGTGMNKNLDDGPRNPNLMTPQCADL